MFLKFFVLCTLSSLIELSLNKYLWDTWHLENESTLSQSLKARNSWKTTSAIEKKTIMEEVASNTGENVRELNYWPKMILYPCTEYFKGNWLNQSQNISWQWPYMCTAQQPPTHQHLLAYCPTMKLVLYRTLSSAALNHSPPGWEVSASCPLSISTRTCFMIA